MDNKMLHVYEVFANGFALGSRKIEGYRFYVRSDGGLSICDVNNNEIAIFTDWNGIIDLGEAKEE